MPIDLSLIIPVYNEEDNCGLLYAAIVRAVDPLNLRYEILFVDDGSVDQSFARLEAIARKDSRVRVIKLRRNYGQTPAMAAGIDHAEGEILITMDGDLQNDPADIPNFLEKIAEGYDIVVGWRQRRQDALIRRKIPSRIANWLIGKVTGVPIRDNGCSLKAYRASVIKQVPLYSEMHRFIPAMSSITGARIAEIKVRHHARKFGKSKYGLSRIYKVLLDLIAIKTILTVAERPIYFFGTAGLLAGLTSLCLLLSLLVEEWLVAEPHFVVIGGLSVLFGTLGIALFSLGLIGEYGSRSGDFRLKDFAAVTPRRTQWIGGAVGRSG
jgi:glycosyltransferase involved in cell wall biosynthesis